MEVTPSTCAAAACSPPTRTTSPLLRLPERALQLATQACTAARRSSTSRCLCAPRLTFCRPSSLCCSHLRCLRQVIPKVRGRLTQLSKATEEDKPLLGHLMYVAAQVRASSGARRSWRSGARVGRAVRGLAGVRHAPRRGLVSPPAAVAQQAPVPLLHVPLERACWRALLCFLLPKPCLPFSPRVGCRWPSRKGWPRATVCASTTGPTAAR